MLIKNSQSGFTLPEVMVSILILLIIVAGVYTSFSTGQDTWATTNTQVLLQQDLRTTIEHVSKELQETGSAQLIITDGAGFANSDGIRFSIPVICKAGTSIIDANGNVAHWGAPLTWGCFSSTCMDADDNCATVDYQYITD